MNAGVLDSQAYFEEIPEETRTNLRVLGETEAVARQVAIARPNMDPALQDAIKAILLGASENEAGQAALETFKTTKFDEFPDGAEATLNRMQEMYELTQSK